MPRRAHTSAEAVVPGKSDGTGANGSREASPERTWQHLFADVQLHADDYIHARKRLTTMLQVLPEIFPGHDYEPLRARLAQRLR
ncbi:hypothetical protein AB0L13_14915 [Saccharopolyspora shandongensis]|uniref:hypothetical protein n=1 Tax=Saccharopolyspora shandongensis TaxID=418495 RepID=UPI003446D4A5